MINVLVGIPWERNVSSTAAVALLGIAARGHTIVTVPYMATDRARNAYAEALLSPENAAFDALCMLDSDMVHGPDTVELLARHFDDDHQIVGALGFRRGVPFDPCAYIRDEPGKMTPIQQWNAGLVEVQAIGFTAILIGRRVLEAMAPRQEGDPPWFYSPVSGVGKLTGHDIHFCRRARALGYRIWCDTDVISPHLMEQAVTGATYIGYMRHLQQQAEREQVEAPPTPEPTYRRQTLTVE